MGAADNVLVLGHDEPAGTAGGGGSPADHAEQAKVRCSVFSHHLERPGWYVESRRFASTPSAPIAAVARHIAGPSALELIAWQPSGTPATGRSRGRFVRSDQG